MKLNIQLFGSRGASSSTKGVLKNKSNDSLARFKESGVRILNKAPKGWIKNDRAVTAPNGYSWYNNGKSMFSGERETALVKD